MSFVSLKDLRKKVIGAALERVYTLNDISHTTFHLPTCAVLGDPIAHSISPILHQRAFQHLGQNYPEYLQWQYIKILVKKEELQIALSLLHARKFRGINLTLPHKIEALKFVNHLTEAARNTGAINTLILEDDGYKGHNTDIFGFRSALKQTFNAIDFSVTPIFLYGARGCASGILEALIQEKVKHLTIINRSAEPLAQIKKHFANRLPSSTQFLLNQNLNHYPIGLYINATSLGLKDDDALPIPIHALPKGSLLFDSIYNENGTKLTQNAEKKGLKAVDGTIMLANQAAEAFKCWTGHFIPPEIFLGKVINCNS